MEGDQVQQKCLKLDLFFVKKNPDISIFPHKKKKNKSPPKHIELPKSHAVIKQPIYRLLKKAVKM